MKQRDQQDAHGPLPAFLLVLTFITGLIDAVSYLKLGKVFVANMTGNVVFLGFGIAGAFSVVPFLIAVAAFLTGAYAGGKLGMRAGHHRGRYLALATYANVVMLSVAFALSFDADNLPLDVTRYLLISVLAIAMGLQNAVARRLAVPDLTTTVLTLILTGLAADSSLVDDANRRLKRRVMAVALMFAGAAVGAYLVLNVNMSAALGLALLLQVLNGVATVKIWSSDAAWTVGR